MLMALRTSQPMPWRARTGSGSSERGLFCAGVSLPESRERAHSSYEDIVAGEVLERDFWGSSHDCNVIYSSVWILEKRKKWRADDESTLGTGEEAGKYITEQKLPPSTRGRQGWHRLTVCRSRCRHMLQTFRAAQALMLGPSRQQPRYLWLTAEGFATIDMHASWVALKAADWLRCGASP